MAVAEEISLVVAPTKLRAIVTTAGGSHASCCVKLTISDNAFKLAVAPLCGVRLIAQAAERYHISLLRSVADA